MKTIERNRALNGYKGERGTFHVNDTNEHEKTFVGFRVDADAVIEELEIDGADVLGDYISDASTAMPASAILKVKPSETPFSKIKLTSGSVSLILG